MQIRPPKQSRALARAQAAFAKYRAERSALQTLSIARGLVLLAVVIFAGNVWRAGVERAFVPGWWRLW